MWFIPIVVIGLALVVVSILALLTRRYKKCSPNEVLVIFGRQHKVSITDPETGESRIVEKGYRLVQGGAAFVWPMLESMERIELNVFQVPFRVDNTPNVDGVPVSVEALANMKVSSDPERLAAAVERLLEMDKAEVQRLCTSTLEGHLRQIVGELTVESVITKREEISQKVLAVARTELTKLGFQLDNFVIQKIKDEVGYIDALGKKRTAEVHRDATIAEAESKRDADIKSAVARREGQTAQAKADEEISNANRERDEVVADNMSKVQAKQARIQSIAETARQEELKKQKVAEVAAEEAEVEARTKLQLKEAERNAAALHAAVVVKAEKEKEALIIAASAKEAAASRDGEAQRILLEKQGQGERVLLEQRAEGRKASAAADRVEKEAAAKGQEALLVAEARGTEAQGKADAVTIAAKGKAEGEAQLAVLHAEAKGFEEKNIALSNLSEGAKLILILERLPEIINEGGDAMEQALGAAFKSVGEGLGNIEKVQVIDMGSHGNGHSPVAGFALNIPEIVAQTFTKFQAMGVNPEKLLSMVGIDVSELQGMVNGKDMTPPAAPPPDGEPEKDAGKLD